MMKRIILGFTALVLVGAGVAVFAANTAQWVNVTAHVEKEIEVACVVKDEGGWVVDPDGCDFGIVFPQEALEKNVEVTLSKSFMGMDNDRVSDVFFHVLWECKLVDEDALASADNLCREDLAAGVEGKLTGNIRDYITVTSNYPTGCEKDYAGPADGGLAKIKGIADGVIDKDQGPKCFYHLALDVPVCKGHFNPNTDTGRPGVVDCVEDLSSDDPQLWERYADLGDTFKIQVDRFSYEP